MTIVEHLVAVSYTHLLPERLDYLKDLGVTHIQLLPVLSYYFVNEMQNGKRLDCLLYTSAFEDVWVD